MVLTPGRKKQLAASVGRSIARYIRYVHRTSQVILEPPDAHARIERSHPCIMSGWHGQFSMLVCEKPASVAVATIAARHSDGDFVVETMADFGIEAVRGAGANNRDKDHGGAHALRGAIRLLRSGKSFVMTADVPPGPARKCGPGIIMLARLSGRPILPVAVASSRFRTLNTWSRMVINLPWSKLAYVVGDEISVPPDANEELMEQKRQQLEAALNRAHARAYELAGVSEKRVAEPDAADQSDFRLRTYRRATSILRPIAPLMLSWRERQGKEDPARRGERFGVSDRPRPEGPLVWIHAASVGETNAILPLIDGLRSANPQLNFVLTTGTVTSAKLAAARLGPRAFHQYVPLDSPEFARRFIGHWRPDLAIFTESEIWPNLILESSAGGVPMALVNARMSGRSYHRWQRNRSLSRPLFSRFDIVLAQNEDLARRFGDLGARNVSAVGNLKIDSPAPPIDARALEKLRAALGDRPALVVASTHAGEEELIADAHALMARDIAGLCTILAPRHPERGLAIAEQLKRRGLTVAQRSIGVLPGQRTDIYIADTIGELGTLYALSPVAFIGGSLVAHGGQNPIEALRHGAAVITGPHVHNFRDAYRTLLKHKGAISVNNADELARAAAFLLRSEPERLRMRAGAASALDALGGALDRTIKALTPMLPKVDERLPCAT